MSGSRQHPDATRRLMSLRLLVAGDAAGLHFSTAGEHGWALSHAHLCMEARIPAAPAAGSQCPRYAFAAASISGVPRWPPLSSTACAAPTCTCHQQCRWRNGLGVAEDCSYCCEGGLAAALRERRCQLPTLEQHRVRGTNLCKACRMHSAAGMLAPSCAPGFCSSGCTPIHSCQSAVTRAEERQRSDQERCARWVNARQPKLHVPGTPDGDVCRMLAY